jgi:hypothetical protein
MQTTAELTKKVDRIENRVESFIENTGAQLILINGKIKMLEARKHSCN